MTSNGAIDLSPIARPSGAFAMVAADQRESLRSIYLERTGIAVPDDTLRAFKVAAARVLSPHASALLLDRTYGSAAAGRGDPLDPACGLILAADALVQEPGGPVTETHLDGEAGVEWAKSVGAVAQKLLVIWREDGQNARRLEMVERFIANCRSAGLISLVEAVVRSKEGEEIDREKSALEAAQQIGALRPDVYKAEVPFLGQASNQQIESASHELTQAVGVPWVVLSAGVALERFESAVEAACRGGASGFLAGRAIWSDAISTQDLTAGLQAIALPRLKRLAAAVDRLARPWWDASKRAA